MNNLTYTIAKENLKVLGSFLKGIAVGVSAVTIAIINAVVGTDIDNSYQTKTKHFYEEEAIIQGYSIGRYYIGVIITALALLVFFPALGKIYIAMQVVAIVYAYITFIGIQLTQDINEYYSREVRCGSWRHSI